MQHLKSKNNSDIDLLKFFLDVEHLNSELEKPSVVCDPVKLSELQQRSEKLLTFYQTSLFQSVGSSIKPDNLMQSFEQARQALDTMWKNEFYKSAEYFELTYGAKEPSAMIPEHAQPFEASDAATHQPKFSTKLRNVMTIKPVEGLEATEIPIWDALDHPLGHSSYYNSVAVKLRKERGQDLDGFMQAFFNSIEQDTDIGEDIATTQTQEEANERLRKKLHPGDVELYKNLFNITGHSESNGFTTVLSVKSSVDSAIYLLSSILNIPKIFLKFLVGFVRLLPDSDRIIQGLVTKFLRSIISESILAKLINELEEKVFDSTPSTKLTADELKQRMELASTRIESVNRNLPKILSFLQNPVLNKHLVYCLIDVIAVELFPELNANAKD